MSVGAVLKMKIGQEQPTNIVRHGKRWESGTFAPTLLDAEKVKSQLDKIDPYNVHMIVKIIVEKGINVGETKFYRVFYRRNTK